MAKLNRKLIILALFILIFYISITSVTAASFNDVQDKIDTATGGDDVYLDNTTYDGSGTEITIDKDLRVHGGSASDPNRKSTLNAKKLSRIFNVQGNHNVSFINLNIINGKATGYNRMGGAVYNHDINYNGSLKFINCTFVNSSTNGTYFHGGAIYSSSSVSVVNSSFVNSSANGQSSFGGTINGGAIYSSSSISVVNSSFVNSSTNANGQCSAGRDKGEPSTVSIFSWLFFSLDAAVPFSDQELDPGKNQDQQE